MVHATTLFEVSRGEIHGRQFALFIKFMQCFFKVSASATADDCIALHCIALVFTCKILMINKRGRCFNHDPVSPSKTLLERTSLAWKHGKQLQIFILKMVGSCFSCLLQAWEPHHAPEPAAPSLAKPFHALLCRG